MDKAIRFLILGAVIGVCVTWLSGDLAVRAESSAGEITELRGVFHQTLEREIAWVPAPWVVLHNQHGGVTVTSWDKDAVSVMARKHVRESQGFWSSIASQFRSTSDESMAAAMEQIHVIIESTPEKVSIDTELPSRRFNGNRWVDYELRVPKNTVLELHTSNGRIDVTEVAGDLILKSSNGQIVTNKTWGDVNVETSNGAVSCRNAYGPLDLETSNGGITIEYEEALAADDNIECVTSNGSIDVALPQDAAFSLDARTSNGRIRSDFPLAVPTAHDQKHITADVAGGGATIRLRTSNGGIRVGWS